MSASLMIAKAAAATFGLSLAANLGFGVATNAIIGGLALRDLNEVIEQDKFAKKNNLKQTKSEVNTLYARLVIDCILLQRNIRYFKEIGSGAKIVNIINEAMKKPLKIIENAPEKEVKGLGYYDPNENLIKLLGLSDLKQQYPKKSDDQLKLLIHYTKKHELAHASANHFTYKILGKWSMIFKSADYIILGKFKKGSFLADLFSSSGVNFAEFFAELRSGKAFSLDKKSRRSGIKYLLEHGRLYFIKAAIPYIMLLYYFKSQENKKK